MADYEMISHAEKVFDSLRARLDENGWNYQSDEEKMLISFGVSGDDLPMDFTFVVDAERQLLRVFSKIPVVVPAEKMVEMAVAVCVASHKMIDGSFDYNMEKGEIFFRLTATFFDSDIGNGVFDHLIQYSVFAVDKFNDRFFGLAKGMMNINDFIQQANN